MSYTVGNLIVDTLPRLSKMPKQSGISIYQAATSIQSLIYKMLLDRKSDIQATGNLDLTIASGGYSVALPTNFLSVAEKPEASELYTDWMAGSVTTYNILTGALVALITTSSGTDTLADWDLALAATPGVPSSVIGASTTSLTVGTGVKNLTVDLGLSLVPGQAIYIITADLPATLIPVKHTVQPSYLGDDNHDEAWWKTYGVDWNGEGPCCYPSFYKVINTTLYVRPTVIMNVKITGRYFAKPTQLTLPADVILWDGLFDEVFREGVIRMLSMGISIPEANKDFAIFLTREVEIIINSRITQVPDTRRLKRGSFL
jgi:hypothetical protein